MDKWHNRLLQAFRSTGLAKRWLLAYLVFIFAPAVLLLYSYYNRSIAILEEEVAGSIQQTLKQAALNIAYRLDNIHEMSNSLFMNPQLHDILRDSSAPIGTELQHVANLSNLINTVQMSSDVYRVRLYVGDNRIYAGERVNFFSLEEARGKPWYNEVMRAGGAVVWTGVYHEEYIDGGKEEVFSSLRMLRDPNHYDQPAGILSLDVREGVLEDSLSELQLSRQQRISIIDREGRIVLHADANQGLLEMKPKLDSDLLTRIKESNEGIERFKDGSDTVYIIHAGVRENGWKLVAEIPAVEISSRAVKLNNSSAVAVLLVFAFMLLVLMFIVIVLILQYMKRSINKVVRIIQKEGVNKLDAWNGLPRSEFHVLQRSVDGLIHQMRVLMQRAYRSQVLEREAQLRALQAQINPHFLYNTLDTINWIAMRHDAHDVSQMIERLAQYFRLSLNRGKDQVTFADELTLARVYLDIQQYRFPGSFHLEIDVAPELLPYLLPKLTLQPIIENALLHGIQKSDRQSGVIRIRAWLKGDDLHVEVSDNGIGMGEEQVRSLLSEPAPDKPSESGGSSYGLYNVNERIKLFAGEAYGISIHSLPEEGTNVTVVLCAVTRGGLQLEEREG